MPASKSRIRRAGLLAAALIALVGTARAGDPGVKKPFTVDDVLRLGFLNHWSQPRFACHGDLIVYSAVDRYYERSAQEEAGGSFIPQGSHLFIRSMGEEGIIPVTEGPEFSWTPSWAPDGRSLAFYGWKEDAIRIGLWNRAARRAEYVPVHGLHGSGPIAWDPAGRKIYFVSSPVEWKGTPEPYEASEDPIIRTTEQKVNPYDERFLGWSLGQLSSYEPGSGRQVSVTPRPMIMLSWKLSPDGKSVAVLELVENLIRVLDTTISNLDIYPSGGGEPARVVSRSGLTQYAWSPDGRSLAYVDGGRLCLYSMAVKTSSPLSGDGIRITGDPLWLPGSQEIFCAAGEDLYLFEVPTGRTKPVRIAAPLGKGGYVLDPRGRSVFFQTVDQETGKQGLYKASLRGGRAEELLSGDWMIDDVVLAGTRMLFTLQNSTTPENLWALDPRTRARRQLTELNKDISDYALGRSALIAWKGSTGDPLKGVLLFPADYEPGKKYPVIFWVYETWSHYLHHFYVHLYNLQLLTNRGYAVFLPDVNFTIGDTSLSYIRSVEPAADRLLELGIANGKFGVMGHSYGGYATNAIVTHSKRFHAAVAISGISDWISFHGLPADYMRLSNERGQGRMGGDLREFPEHYVKNSPVFFLHQVTAPLMILHGTKDYGVPFSQAEEMYYGLRHLGKTAALIGYPGEDHLYWGTKVKVIKDSWRRINAWFDTYLK